MKKSKTKLALHRETLRTIEQGRMVRLAGGLETDAGPTYCDCPWSESECQPMTCPISCDTACSPWY